MSKMKVTHFQHYYPIILGSVPRVIIPENIHLIYSTIGELKDRFRIDSFNSNLVNKYETRNKYFLVSKGVMWYKSFIPYSSNSTNDYEFLVIICFNTLTKKYEALVNENYITDNPGHKTFINAFIKKHDINPRKNVTYERNVYLSNFNFKVSDEALQKLTNPNNQIKFIQDFKKQQLWKTPV